MDDAERIRRLTVENETLKERIRQMERAMKEHTPLFHLPLEPKQRAMVNLLLLREAVTHDAMATVLGMNYSTIKVQMSKIRRKLAPLGVKIGTDWGAGYYLTPDMKEKVRHAAN